MSVKQNYAQLVDHLQGLNSKQKSWAVQISKLHSDGQITEQRIHSYPFGRRERQCFDLGACTVYKSSLQSTPGFTIFSTHRGNFQNLALSRLTVTLLSLSGVP